MFRHLFLLCCSPLEQAQFLISLTSSFAHNISSSTLHPFVLVLLSSSSFNPSLLSFPRCLTPFPTSYPQPSSPSNAAGPSRAGERPPLLWEEVAGSGGLVGPGGICSSDSCTPACGCREAQHRGSALPFHLEDFFGVIVGGINSFGNICCHIIL